jgi:hypothetical protein
MRYLISDFMKVFATFLFLAMSSSTAVAQDDLLPEEEEEIRRYTVELIVFSYVQDVSVGTEIFPPDEPIVDDTLLLDLGGPIESDLVVIADEPKVPEIPEEVSVEDGDELEEDDSRLVFLLEDEFTLSDIAERFERLDVYETIMHVGWTQPTHPEEETQAIELWEFGDVPEGLDGRFTLYLSRYLHLVVDLSLDAPSEFDETVIVDEVEITFGDSRYQFDPGPEEASMPVRYRILDDRIFKNGETRYFDHPKFGVVARITRVEEELEDLEEIKPEQPPSTGVPGQ